MWQAVKQLLHAINVYNLANTKVSYYFHLCKQKRVFFLNLIIIFCINHKKTLSSFRF